MSSVLGLIVLLIWLLRGFLGVCDVEELKLKARVSVLLREEAELRRVCSAMLRSGSYLPRYVEKTLREPGRPISLIRGEQVPLKSLNPKEEKAFRKIATRREEIAEIQLRLLHDVKPFRLRPDTNVWSCGRLTRKRKGR